MKLFFFKSAFSESDKRNYNRAYIEHFANYASDGENENVVYKPHGRNAEKLGKSDKFSVIAPHGISSHDVYYQQNY